MINHNSHKNKMETTHFFNNVKIIQMDIIPKFNLIITHRIIFHQLMMNTIAKIINIFPQTKYLILTVLVNQIFLNHTHEMNKKHNLEIIQHLSTIIFNNKKPVNIHSYQPTQMHNEIPLPCYLQQHEITKSQQKLFSNATCRRITTNDYESILNGSIINNIKKPLMVFTGTDPEYSVED